MEAVTSQNPFSPVEYKRYSIETLFNHATNVQNFEKAMVRD
jgi:hypothetical protein